MHAPAVTLTRILHPCVLVEMGRTRVLIDPCFGGFTRRARTSRLFGLSMPEPGLPPEDLTDLSLMALTHGHEDHFDVEGIARLPGRDIQVLVGERRLARRIRGLGFRRVDLLRPWESLAGDGWEITATPARSPNARREISFVLSLGATRILHAGDTAMHGLFPEIRERCSPTAACLPVNGVSLLGIRLTMTPRQAAAAAAQLGVRVVIPIHDEMRFGGISRLLYRAPGDAARLEEEVRLVAPGVRVVRAPRGERIPLPEGP